MSTIMKEENKIDIGISIGSGDDDVNVSSSGRNGHSTFGRDVLEDELKGSPEIVDSEDDGSKDGGTYPADCYSFMSIHGPTSGYFYFGFIVWAFQIAFLILMVLHVIHPKLSTSENDDNPDAGQSYAFWGNFIPSGSGNLSKATQFMALITYCVFADESLKDIVTAVETFPNFKRIKQGDKVHLIILSCLLRLIQGLLASFVVFLLVCTTNDVVDIVLNFTAVNFISSFDDVAFELAQWGKYGPAIKAEADRIEELPCPACMHRKRQHIRYVFTVVPVFIALLLCLILLTYRQDSSRFWLTDTIRVQFKDDELRNVYNGCYKESMRIDKRVVFQSNENNAAEAKFGYCQQEKKWYLYTGNSTHPCDIAEIDKVAFSSKTYFFDFSSVTEETWYSRTGTPLELYFFDDNKNSLNDEECASFLGDGHCDEVFNFFDHRYDGGDCCAATCEGLKCGVGALTQAFNKNVTSGNGYPTCGDPHMKNITIKLNNVYTPPKLLRIAKESVSPFAGLPPRDPLMIMDCDGTNVLMTNIRGDMKFETHTVQVADGADCIIKVQNSTGGPLDMQFVNYTIYHGNKESIETDPIVMLHADSIEKGIHRFKRIPECFFDKLKNFVDIPTIYTGDGPQNKAIQWLLHDSQGFSNCEYDTFVERYALATINYAAPRIDLDSEGSPTELWINSNRHCVWPNVACVDESVVELDLAGATGILLSGTIATEIGLLPNIHWLDMSNNIIYGTIPTEIGQWQTLNYFGVDYNMMTGTIPTEIGKLTSGFEYFLSNNNQLTGTIPTEIGAISSLRAFTAGNNDLVGKIPCEIEQVSLLEFFFAGNNTLTGTIPSVFGKLSNLIYLSSFLNSHTGNIPSELGQLTALRSIQLPGNDLTGSIPAELLSRTYSEFNFYGNPLSGLTPVEGSEICNTGGGEIYCNCRTDCTFSAEQCVCEEAVSCCTSFLEQYTECKVCQSGVENPNRWLPDFITTCSGMEKYISNSVLEFGNEELCDGGKFLFDKLGCRCRDEDINESPESLISGPFDV